MSRDMMDDFLLIRSLLPFVVDPNSKNRLTRILQFCLYTCKLCAWTNKETLFYFYYSAVVLTCSIFCPLAFRRKKTFSPVSFCLCVYGFIWPPFNKISHKPVLLFQFQFTRKRFSLKEKTD